MGGWSNGWIDRWMEGWLDSKMNGVDVQCTPLRTQTGSPFSSVKKIKQESFTSVINHTKQISTQYNLFFDMKGKLNGKVIKNWLWGMLPIYS